MNKELIKQYKAEFEHWLNSGSVLSINCLNTCEWTEVDCDSHWDACQAEEYKPMFIINDEYIEFRKALSEGKTIQHNIANTGNWEDLLQPSFIDPLIFKDGTPCYRIKPEEPQFTYPMWFKYLSTAEVWKFTAITQGHRIDDELYRTHKPHTDKAIWTQIPEPKPTIKVAKYRYFNNHRHWADTVTFYKDDADYFLGNPMYKQKFARLLETEIEVEDY